MRRTILVSAVVSLLLASCSSDTDEGQDAEPTGASTALGAVASPSPTPSPSVLSVNVGWDGTTCTYVGPRTLVENRQRLRIRFEDRSDSESVFLVFGGLHASANYERFVAWASTHEVNFYSLFPPPRFIVPGIGQVLGAEKVSDGMASAGPFAASGRYYVACVAWPPDENGSTIHPAALLEVIEPG